MKRPRTRTDGSSRAFFIAVLVCTVVALVLIVGIQLLMKGGGGHSDVAITSAPDEHPSPVASGGPDLHFSTTSIDLGLVPLGKQVGYSFSFANVGAKALRIGDVNVRAVQGC